MIITGPFSRAASFHLIENEYICNVFAAAHINMLHAHVYMYNRNDEIVGRTQRIVQMHFIFMYNSNESSNLIIYEYMNVRMYEFDFHCRAREAVFIMILYYLYTQYTYVHIYYIVLQ